MKDWKNRTCQDCAFNVDGFCRFNPPLIFDPRQGRSRYSRIAMKVLSMGNKETVEYSPACSQYTYKFATTFEGVHPDDVGAI